MQLAAEAAVREHLAKVLTSAEFQKSERLCRFLTFIVNARLRGEQDQVKEYLIGKEVFDRDDNYDPRLDPIVRVEARRLRKKLEAYYAGRGSGDAIRFELPKGAYVPEIIETPAPDVEESVPVAQQKSHWNWKTGAASALVVAACALAAYFWLRPPAIEPVVAVVPARWIWTGNDFPDLPHDEDLAERIGSKLSAHRELQMLSWPSIQQFRGTGKTTIELAAQFAVTRMILVAVRLESDGYRVTAFLIDPKKDRKLSVPDMRRVALDSPENREQVAAQMAEKCLQALRDSEKVGR